MARRRKGNPVHGWVNFDKPYGMTSTQAVGKVRWLYQAQKAGHAGTLDPLASGILPIALGDATKTVPFLVESKKVYDCEIKWGERTTTLDAEGDVVATSDVRPNRAQIEAALPQFIGEILQTPPVYSAIKIDGQRAYDLARAGETPEMKPRPVRIDDIEVLDVGKDMAILRIFCGKGTYIRSLARDLAFALGTEGSVANLRRISVGPFALEGENDCAFSLDALEELVHKGGALDALLAVSTALDDIPALAVTDDEAFDLKLGRAILVHPSAFAELRTAFRPRQIGDLDASRYVLAECEGVEIALCDARAGHLRPKRVFNL
ncbi:MAG: tRNA pseudouridine(55) synthase TruB [Robiginitomaculum sp.]|nr:MAG: tRNA pseudouridine(55) synthase TruB [Robiginitomaculum sp.]